MNRRTFLKGTLAGSVVAVAAAAGLLIPTRVLAAAWPAAAFGAKSIDEAVKALYGSADAPANATVQIKAPPQAEDGLRVNAAVIANVPNVESISLLVAGNAQPLVASMTLIGDAAIAYLSCDVKMGKTSNIKAVVKSQGKLFSATKEVKVTVGGCGG